jgi:hypothetical protein
LFSFWSRWIRYSSLKKKIIVWIINWVYINIWRMQSLILILFSKTLTILLYFCFQYPTYGYNVTTYTWINKIVFYFTFNSLWHFSRVNVIYIIFNLLYFYSLVKWSFSSMFFWIKWFTLTINVYAFVWDFPFAINKYNLHFWFAIQTRKLNRLNKYFYRANT